MRTLSDLLRAGTILITVVAGTTATLAQGPCTYQARIQALDQAMAQKQLSEVMRDAFPFTAYDVDAESRSVIFTVPAPLERTTLEQEMALGGLTLEALYIHQRFGGTDRWLAVGTPSGFPVFVDTGDPVADDAAYQAQKAAWIQNDTELYHQLTEAAGNTASGEAQPE